MNRPDVSLATPWQFPTPTILRLPNGLSVWHFHLPGQHIATFELVLPAPLSDEPLEREGVATVALHAIDEGTVAHPAGRIGELLEANGATLHGVAKYRHTTFGGQAPSRRLGDVLPLFTEILSQPDYEARDVAHHVEAQEAGFDSTLASPGGANRMALRRALYGLEHRDGRPAAGTPATLHGIGVDDVRAWHARHFSPDGATLLIAGAVDPDVVVERLAAWEADGSPASPADTAPVQPRRVVVVDRPDAVQATVAMGLRTVTRDDPRWPALRVAGHAIAGAFASRLNLELRERLGYTYGIGGGFAPGVSEGQFSVGGSIRTEVAGDAVTRLLDGLALAEPFSDAEVDDARRFLIGVAPLANETSADIVAQASSLAAAGLDPAYLARHFDDLAVVSAADATTAYRSVVSPEQACVAVTGDAAVLVPELEERGLTPEVVDLRA
ncbi:hypothetical protein BW730_07035 [Tessaracoccus aquimaris]|uniref:Peptidase M16 C-terminal domain-containing protein n=1 Tax=Tessaracoccus aquimaris TaxID=1332264 RepID=A0A1Q2CMJ2_9ACTN|nr:pitrilysin family protein [Tessaracoccus aquimaris]AQP47290.1 hypothetical protein BW730_07035 [Tessaracoccus aquimaris]